MRTSNASTLYIQGMLVFLIIIPPVLDRAGLFHIVTIALGFGLFLILRSKAFLLVTFLSLSSIFLPSIANMSLWYPVITSSFGFFIFSYSLLRPPSIVERFARLERGDNLPPKAASYCTKVTIAWVFFFLINTLIAFWTVRFGSHRAWAVYNGFISYVLVASLFFGERIIRKYFIDDSSSL